MSDIRWSRLELVIVERDRLQRRVHELEDDVDYLIEEKHMLLQELADRDSTIRDRDDELAERRRRHPSAGRG